MTFSHLPIGSQSYKDKSDFYARFILEKQLLNPALWQKFVEVFRTREDIADDGWRGEYFGKMMRGACLTYRYFPEPALYGLLEKTVLELLSAADEQGRIATYTPEHELCGWDLWCRKYVLVGCLHFYEICRDETIKEKILAAMKRHLDAIEAKVGEGKTPITETSHWYGGMNSSSLLEPVVEMYKMTKEPRYRALAEHIIRRGGCKEGSVIDAVKEGKLLPHEFPTTKAYETMSYFEGILAYYEVTEESSLLSLVEKFSDLVAENEITLIGCAGCRNEHFDHAAVTQANDVPKKTIMQETCVTVTWMRLQERLLRVTGKAKYADRIEVSALNALYGAINLYGEEQYCKEEKRFLSGVPFDSYSPLVPARRGVGIGGYKKFAAGGYYGCCACIGAAGTALYPLASAMLSEKGAVVLFPHEGEIAFPLSGGALRLQITGSVAAGQVEYAVLSAPDAPLEILFRAPTGCGEKSLTVCGEDFSEEDGYFPVRRAWRAGDRVSLLFKPLLQTHLLNGKAAFTFGPFALARDERKEKGKIERVKLGKTSPTYLSLDPQDVEEVRLLLRTEKQEILLTDYASCGKHWTEKKSRIALWQKVK